MRRMSLWALLWILAGVGLPLYSSAVPSPAELLESFRPQVYFEDDGPDRMRVDFPVRITSDDVDIENNFAAGGMSPCVAAYAQVHETVDRAGRPVWVMEYHFYYRRNWAMFDYWLGEFRGYTHEHDWEWIYVVAGLDGATLRPYCASFSAHAARNTDLFGDDGAVRLFPGVTGGSVWRDDWSRSPDMAPRVSLDPQGRLEATASAAGNAFDGAPDQFRSWICFGDYPLLSFEQAQSGCGDPDIYYFGDPALPAGCLYCAGYAECSSPREPPWNREGLGERNPLPFDFELPNDWVPNPSTEHAAATLAPIVSVMPNPARERVRLELSPFAGPVGIEMIDAAGRSIFTLALRPMESRTISLAMIRAGSYFLCVRGPQRLEEVKHVTVLR